MSTFLQSIKLLLIISILPQTLLARQSGLFSIDGEVKDSVSNSPLTNITVLLKMPSSPFEKAVFTKNDGSFLITEVPPGKYNLTISSLGYKVTNINLELSGKRNVSLGRILL